MSLHPAIVTLGVWVLVVAGNQEAPAFAISDERCPTFPQSSVIDEACGPFTYRYCERENAAQHLYGRAESAALVESTDYVIPLHDYVASVEDYLLYHVLHQEYLVQFAKNPMPFQEPIDMPYCGLPTDDPGTTITSGADEEDTIERRGWTWKKNLTKIRKFIEKVEKGAATIAAPFTKPPPKKPRFFPRIHPPRPVCIPMTIRVPVHFTLFATNITTSSLVTQEVLEQQIFVTNTAFEPLGISFFISSVSYHVGREWERFTHNKNEAPGADQEYFDYSQRIKAENRYGGNDEVNVWIVEKIGQENCEVGSHTSGYCTLARYLSNPGYYVDGCAIVIDSLPGIAWRSCEKGTGSTLTHELGHWLDLLHVFPDNKGAGCDGESDEITDTFQFQNSDPLMFNKEQERCCVTGTGTNRRWAPCADGKKYNVTNYMSYSWARGNVIPGNVKESMPWTTEQRTHMFANYFTVRRRRPRFGITCVEYPVFPDAPSGEEKRDLPNTTETIPSIKGLHILRQGESTMDSLIKVCASPPDPNIPAVVDISTGELLKCSEDGECQPPSTGWTCYDKSKPPCKIVELSPTGKCEDNTAPPCTQKGRDMCPGGPSGSPSGPSTSPENPPPGGGKPGDTSKCPPGCNVHENKCDKGTAPTCIYPNAMLEKPRAACACRPGWKSGDSDDTDTTKQWRLPIPHQEHRVWVAEGVPCDRKCDARNAGPYSCMEVSEIPIACAGY